MSQAIPNDPSNHEHVSQASSTTLPPNQPLSTLIGTRERYLQIGVPLYEASIKCDWNAAKAILDKYPRIELIRCSVTDHGETALHIAASANGPNKVEEFVKNLVEKMDPKDLELVNKNNNTALYLAAAAGNTATVKIMVEKNSDLLIIPGGAERNMMPLYAAAMFGHYEVVKYLYDKSDELGDGWTDETRGWFLEKCVESDMFGNRETYLKIGVPLYEASIKCDWNAAKAILDEHQDIELVRCSVTENGETALHIAASANGPNKVEEFVKNLVDKMEPEDLELVNKNNNTALYLAAAAGNTATVKIMVEKNSDLLIIPGGAERNMMPLYAAAMFGHYEVVKYLYDKSDELGDGWTDETRGWFLEKCVESDMFDIAIAIVKKHLTLGRNSSILGLLARKPKAFHEKKSPSNIIKTAIKSVSAFFVREPEKETEALKLLKIIWGDIVKLPKKKIDDILRGPADQMKSTSGSVVQAIQLRRLISSHLTKMETACQDTNLVSQFLVDLQLDTQNIIKEENKTLYGKGDQALKLQKLISNHIVNFHDDIQKLIKQQPREDLARELPVLITNHINSMNESTNLKPRHSSRVVFVAAKMGNTKFLVELIRGYPDLIWKVNDSRVNIAIAIVKKHLTLGRNSSILGLLARKPKAFHEKKSPSNIIKTAIKSVSAFFVREPEKETEALKLLKIIWGDIVKLPKKKIDDILRGPADQMKSTSGSVVQAIQLRRLISSHLTKMETACQDTNLVSQFLVDLQLDTQNIIKEENKTLYGKGDQALKLQKLISNHIVNFHDDIQKLIKQQPREDLARELPVLITNHINSMNESTNLKPRHSSRVVFVAAKMGNTKFLVELIRGYPDLIWKVNDSRVSIFHTAAKHRQEHIFNLLCEIGAMKDMITPLTDENENNMLHLVGKIAKQKRLADVSGFALQMQRELLWFEEVKKMIPPSLREKKNKDELTPHDIFTQEHKELVTQGEKWTKETANKCMVVAALIATIVFAAAFTVPGGYNQRNGMPMFYSKATFVVFVVADAISLFASSGSILIFLSILTSRYAERDFLETIPKKLMAGLATLFISIATMTLAFGVSFFILYHNGFLWIPILIGVFAVLPVILYVFLQYGLFWDVIRSTYLSRYLFKPQKHVLYYENPKV
ncbi:ankyrin repeat-containing domain, PGG domain protein [Artemisia annua]|uniref:Ankyrin repeat-containing domain, PGG domain protein n=1 Tax=Artemisia annua TaxID=35608 RepID=A0A2U1PVT2_ARTAN|nr:ankyrin repeat-containing domain, PGG domain protein [Artemisia annua]